MCISLAKHYQVSLVVADGLGDESINGFHIYDVGKFRTRIKRFFLSSRKVYLKALSLDADIYHFHDPEILPFGKKLKKKDKIVIYDAHEYYRDEILYKDYLPKIVRKLFAIIVFTLEKRVSRLIDAVITPTDEMTDIYQKFSYRCYTIKNFAFKPTNEQKQLSKNIKDIDIIHVGTVLFMRLKYMIDIIKDVKQRNKFVTAYFLGVDQSLISRMNDMMQKDDLTENIFLLPRIPFEEVQTFLFRSKIGLNYHPYETRYLVALPTKVFEYMRCGVAVVTSDLPPLRESIKDSYNGIFIKSNEINDFSDKIISLLNNDKKLLEFGNINKQLINDKFNWEQESHKLFNIYKEILST
jgi:glycosyltransferase involved in cell wall biosynthesis